MVAGNPPIFRAEIEARVRARICAQQWRNNETVGRPVGRVPAQLLYSRFVSIQLGATWIPRPIANRHDFKLDTIRVQREPLRPLFGPQNRIRLQALFLPGFLRDARSSLASLSRHRDRTYATFSYFFFLPFLHSRSKQPATQRCGRAKLSSDLRG